MDNKDLWQARNQILPIISLKEFMKLNVNIGMMIKNAKYLEFNANIASLEYAIIKDDLLVYKCVCCSRNY